MKDWRSSLIDAIKLEAERSLDSGGARAPEVADNVINDHGDLVGVGAAELARGWIVDKARSILKSSVAAANGAKQLHFNGLDDSIVRLLPRCIALPDDGREQEFTFVPIEQATVEQLRNGASYLERCIRRDEARLDAIKSYIRWRQNGPGGSA